MSESKQISERIEKIPLLSGIPAERIADLLDRGLGQIRQYENGETVFSPRDGEKRAGFLLSGRAEVSTPDPTRRTLLRVLERGDAFGIANLFNREPFVSVIRAKGGAQVLFLSPDAIRELLESDTAFLSRYLAFLSDRICFLNRKISFLTAGCAERKLALYLASFASTEVTLPLSATGLSDLLDVGRASLYRAFERLERDGWILRDGKNYRIPDPDALANAYL